ncbi:MAG: penicillin-binding transpeptidase domain-containing protein [Gemmatimonadaceae bacterium]
MPYTRPDRPALIHLALAIFALAIVTRAAQVQLWQRSAWEAKAERQHFAATTMPAVRGTIFDVAGVPLAQSRALVRLAIAPREVKNAKELARELRRVGVDKDWVARAGDTSRAWVAIPKRFLPGDAARLTSAVGVYPEAIVERTSTQRQATSRILGHVGPDGRPIDGVELSLDSVLHGRAGNALLLRDARGSKPTSPADTALAPLAGEDVVLTISQDLQDISERALRDAVDRTGATGGDILIIEPASGEIRAMASIRRDAHASGSPLVSEPFEPGSTIKPFIAAMLLERKKARADDVMPTGFAPYTVEGRDLHDEHPAKELSLADVIRVSSNIGIAKFAQRFTHAEEYQALRDFGFGTQTGVAFPAEASGRLPAPEKWSKQTPASLAIGYEVSVTALQLATAYAALANGGELLEPTLVKEIRRADGRVRYRHAKRVVRRVVDASVAASVRQMLIGVVTGGSGDSAGLGSFQVGGKTGTARRTLDGRYVKGMYTASFVGLFPAEKPQYVILVKIDNPAGDKFFASQVAAPVSRVVLQAAIAARDAALDRGALAAAAPPPPKPQTVALPTSAELDSSSRVAAAGTLVHRDSSPTDTTTAAPYVVSLPLRRAPAPRPGEPRAVPGVNGLPLRDAVRELHRAGFHVQLAGFGEPVSTSPAAGVVAAHGSTVRLVVAP